MADIFFLILHFLGVAVGAGAAYLIVGLHYYAEHHPGQAKSIAGSYKPLSFALRGGLLILVLSGMGLVGNWGTALQNPLFASKVALVILIIVNSTIIGGVVSPRFRELFSAAKPDQAAIARLKRTAGVLSVVQMLSWTAVIILSVINVESRD